jgi:hypothetical protein
LLPRRVGTPLLPQNGDGGRPPNPFPWHHDAFLHPWDFWWCGVAVPWAGWVAGWCSDNGGCGSNSDDVAMEMEVGAIAAMCMGMWLREREGSMGSMSVCDEACS